MLRARSASSWITLALDGLESRTGDQILRGEHGQSSARHRNRGDRYIVWPSQALGYKIGQLKIRALRSNAEKELGQKFDLPAFHDEVLKNGALPLSVLETHLKEWVEKRRNA
jgi:uncharacterized protein (DUF885 family)